MAKWVEFADLGNIEYRKAWALQKALHAHTIAQKLHNRKRNNEVALATSNYLLFCEHNKVFTLGKNGSMDNLLATNEQLEVEKIDFVPINRGGDITYHGPGQLTAYPIFDLDHFFSDIGRYLRGLEESVILVCSYYGLNASRIEGLTGVWLDAESPKQARKICAIGVHSSRWVTMHGFAFNVVADLSPFGLIVPCGIQNKGVTSLHLECEAVDFNKVKAQTKEAMESVFGFQSLQLKDLDFWVNQTEL